MGETLDGREGQPPLRRSRLGCAAHLIKKASGALQGDSDVQGMSRRDERLANPEQNGPKGSRHMYIILYNNLAGLY